MANEELESGLIRVVNAVEKLAASTQSSLEALTRKGEQLTDAQLRFQSQLGDMARIFQARIEEHERVIAEMRAESQAIKQRQAESDQRFEVLLAEVRYLIRQLPPPQDPDRPSSDVA